MNAKDRRRLATQLELLDSLLRSPTRRASLGEISRHNDAPFPDRGAWRGPAIRELRRDGLIQVVGAVCSHRPSRRKAPIWIWEIVDFNGCWKRANRIRERLEEV